MELCQCHTLIEEGEILANTDLSTTFVHKKTHKSVESYLSFWDGKEVFIKRYPKPSGLPKIFKHLIRGSSAACAVRGSLILNEAGFSAPTVIALIEKQSGLKLKRSAAVFEALSHLPQLAEYILHNIQEQRIIISELANEIGLMHSMNLMHGDMTIHNILLAREKGNFKFIWTDNRKTCKKIWLSQRNIVKNFSQLYAHAWMLTSIKKLRFLLTYAKHRSLTKHECRAIAAKVLKRVGADIAEHNFQSAA